MRGRKEEAASIGGSPEISTTPTVEGWGRPRRASEYRFTSSPSRSLISWSTAPLRGPAPRARAGRLARCAPLRFPASALRTSVDVLKAPAAPQIREGGAGGLHPPVRWEDEGPLRGEEATQVERAGGTGAKAAQRSVRLSHNCLPQARARHDRMPLRNATILSVVKYMHIRQFVRRGACSGRRRGRRR